MPLDVEIYPSSSGSSKDVTEEDKGSHEACIDAMHRLLLAIEKKDPEAMHEALMLHESVCEDEGAEEA